MGKRIILCLMAIVFLGILSAWLYADAHYDYPIYEYRETGRFLEYLDRYGGWETEAVPIYEPDNPAWVTTIRRIAPLSLLVLFCAVLYMVVQMKDEWIRKLK